MKALKDGTENLDQEPDEVVEKIKENLDQEPDEVVEKIKELEEVDNIPTLCIRGGGSLLVCCLSGRGKTARF